MLRLCCAFFLWVSFLLKATSYSGFRGSKRFHCFRGRKSATTGQATDRHVQGVDLTPLVHVNSDGNYLSSKIAHWLDVEYMPQEIHSKLGKKVHGEYKRLRDAGVNDLGEILIRLGTALEAFDMENAFVNGWDVANKASELLISRLDKHDYHVALDAINENTAHLESVVLRLSSGFERYRTLQRYLEGDTLYRELHSVLGFLLGFRSEQTVQGARFLQQQQLAPLRWEALQRVPCFDDTENAELSVRLAADLPDDAGSVDVVMESLVGMELYGELRRSTDLAVQRRVLIAKWMYIQGFLNSDFPAVERYVPAHLQRELEDKE